MIHAEKARALTVEASAIVYKTTLETIEKEITEKANHGYRMCQVFVREDQVMAVTHTIEAFGYQVRIRLLHPSTKPPGEECLAISW